MYLVSRGHHHLNMTRQNPTRFAVLGPYTAWISFGIAPNTSNTFISSGKPHPSPQSTAFISRLYSRVQENLFQEFFQGLLSLRRLLRRETCISAPCRREQGDRWDGPTAVRSGYLKRDQVEISAPPIVFSETSPCGLALSWTHTYSYYTWPTCSCIPGIVDVAASKSSPTVK